MPKNGVFGGFVELVGADGIAGRTLQALFA